MPRNANVVSSEITRELAKWDDKVIFNVQFKPDTKAPLKRLNDFLYESLSHFVLISANTEALVYKIGRYFVENGVKNDEITFIDGEIVKSYVYDERSPEWKIKERIDDFISIFALDIKDKWVIIPYMNFSMSIGIAIYLQTQIRKMGARGLLYYSEGPDNFTECLMYNASYLEHFYQFPRADYIKPRRRKIVDDEY